MALRLLMALLVPLLLAGSAQAVSISLRTSPPPPASGGGYVGPDACLPCHEPQHRFQSAGRHARAMALLPAESAADPICLRCHATGYGYAGGYGPGGGPVTLAGITCEACHGPGGEHIAAGAKTATAIGDCPDCLKGKICLPCHTPERAPEFDLPVALKRAGCPTE